MARTKETEQGPLTPKGRPRDGYYYKVECPEHGKTEGVCIGRILLCIKCSEKGIDKHKIKLQGRSMGTKIKRFLKGGGEDAKI